MTKAQHIYQYEIRYCLTSKPTLTIRCHNPNNCTLYQFPHEFQRKVSMEIEKCPWSHFYTNFTRIKIIMISVYIGKTKHLLARQYEHLRTSIFTDRALNIIRQTLQQFNSTTINISIIDISIISKF